MLIDNAAHEPSQNWCYVTQPKVDSAVTGEPAQHSVTAEPAPQSQTQPVLWKQQMLFRMMHEAASSCQKGLNRTEDHVPYREDNDVIVCVLLYLQQQVVDPSIAGHASSSGLGVNPRLHQGSHVQRIRLGKQVAKVFCKILQQSHEKSGSAHGQSQPCVLIHPYCTVH